MHGVIKTICKTYVSLITFKENHQIIHFILYKGLSISVKYLLEMGANPRTKGCLSLSLELYHRNVFLTLIETEAGNYEVRNLLKMFFGNAQFNP